MATKTSIIQAKLISKNEVGYCLDCEGDKQYFPKRLVSFDEEKQELEAPNWLLREKFPGEGF